MRRNLKKLAALGLTLCMSMSLLAGCGTSKDSATTEPAAEQTNEVATESTPDSEATEVATTAYDFSDREHYTIKLMMFGDATTEQCDAVAAELSKITEEKLNADVQLIRVGFGSYITQLNLALSSGEELDVFAPFTLNTTTLANNGQILALSDLLQAYAPETYAQITPEDFACTSVSGEIYAVPSNKDKGYSLGFMMRKDILDEIGVSVDDIQSFDDLHDVLVKVKESHPDMYPVVPDYAATFGYFEEDALIDNFGSLLDPYTSDELKLENFYASDYYNDLCTMMYQWTNEGLVMPDASSNTEGGNSLIAAGKAFGRFSHMKAGFDSENTTSTGTEIVSWIYRDALSVTTSASLGWAVSANSGDPERATALINLMYTDPEVSNLVINGIEGVHYQVVDSDKGIIDYPEGVDSSTVGYSRMAWGWPNEQISYIWNGDSETVWQELAEFNKNAKPSPAKGFAFDNASVLNEVTACTNVVSKYHNALIAGSVDPATTIPKFVKELEDAGINTIIAEKQKQIDIWAAMKK